MVMPTQTVPGDFATMDAALFPNGTDSPAPQPEESQTPPRQQPDPTAALAERLQRLENTITSGQRQLQNLLKQRQDIPEQLSSSLREMRQQFADLKEEQEFQLMTPEEQVARLRARLADAQKPAPPEPEAVINRTDGWFVDEMNGIFRDEMVPEIQEMAADMGVQLTADQFENLRLYAINGSEPVPIVKQGGQFFPAWDDWLRRVVRPALRQEAQRQASLAKQTNGQRPNQAATGGGVKSSAGGTPQLDFRKSSLSDELNTAGWGSLS